MIDAKKYLLKVRTADLQVTASADDLQSAYDLLFRVTPTLKDVSSIGGDMKSKTDNVLDKIELYIERLNRSTDRYIDIREAATSYLVKLSSQKHFAVLHKRYFEYDRKTYKYKTFEEIALEMGTSKQNVDRLHGRALLALDNLMKEVDKS